MTRTEAHEKLHLATSEYV